MPMRAHHRRPAREIRRELLRRLGFIWNRHRHGYQRLHPRRATPTKEEITNRRERQCRPGRCSRVRRRRINAARNKLKPQLSRPFPHSCHRSRNHSLGFRAPLSTFFCSRFLRGLLGHPASPWVWRFWLCLIREDRASQIGLLPQDLAVPAGDTI
jgi:hypothetical protein